MSIVLDPMQREASVVLEEIRLEDEKRRREIMNRPGCSPCDRPAVDPTYYETYKRYQAKERAVSDPTTLILVDEADRLQMNSLEQMRSIFDEGAAGMVLIGMPGIEKRVARFPQFYSRIGFVHEFHPLDGEQVQALLESRWVPAGVKLPDEQLLPEVIASLIRMTGGISYSWRASSLKSSAFSPSTTCILCQPRWLKRQETASSSARGDAEYAK